jgi:hypothetical protein
MGQCGSREAALRKQLVKLDKERADIMKRLEAEKSILQKIEAEKPVFRKEIEDMIAKAHNPTRETSTMYMSSGLHMTDLSVYGDVEWPTVAQELDIKKVVQYDIRGK